MIQSVEKKSLLDPFVGLLSKAMKLDHSETVRSSLKVKLQSIELTKVLPCRPFAEIVLHSKFEPALSLFPQALCILMKQQLPSIATHSRGIVDRCFKIIVVS